jgi:hypothetical protein
MRSWATICKGASEQCDDRMARRTTYTGDGDGGVSEEEKLVQALEEMKVRTCLTIVIRGDIQQ